VPAFGFGESCLWALGYGRFEPFQKRGDIGIKISSGPYCPVIESGLSRSSKAVPEAEGIQDRCCLRAESNPDSVASGFLPPPPQRADFNVVEKMNRIVVTTMNNL
jgi:hypothetical protein